VNAKREITAYHPLADAKERWPDWHIAVTNLAGIPSIICPRRKIILVDRGQGPEEVGLARAVAQLDLGHHNIVGEFTREQMDRAKFLADIRLDREGSRE
jgi:hypothetical protein